MSNGWQTRSLEELVSFSSGGTPRKSNAQYWGGEFPWITAKDLKRPVLMDSQDRLTKAGIEAAKVTCKDSLLILVRGMTLFKDVPVCLAGRDMAFNQDIKALVVCNGVDPKYLQTYLGARKHEMLRLVDSAGHGTGRMNMDMLRKFPVTVPPLHEQKAIADLLSTWNEAIEKTERLIRAKEAYLKGQIQKLISQRCDYWPHSKPKKIFDTITEKNFPEEELLSVTQDRGVIPRSMLDGRVMSPDGTTTSYKLIKQGDFAISLRSFQGGIEYSNYQGLISPAYTVLRPKIELNNNFYRLFFKSYIFIEKYLNLAVIGIRDGRQISIPDFLSIKIPVPPLKEQKEIAEALSICQQEIDLLKRLAEQYKTQKRGLTQKMLTGEWRVKPEVVKSYE